MEGFKESVENIAYVSVGPFGGERGKAWDDGIHTSVRQLIICSGSVRNSIQIEYDDHGCPKWSKKHAESTEGGVTNVVKLEYPGEYLISLSGYYDVEGDHVVSSLTFLSNKQQYGPYGSGKEEYFSFPLSSGKIIGFHGRSSDHYLHSVGAYLEPYPSVFIGPFGGVNGREWDDEIYTTVRQLIIFYGSSVVESIQIEYDKNGHSKCSDRHGQAEGGTRIRSNRQQYGPYGIEQGKPFSTSSSSSSTQGKIVGFHGRSGLYLDSIGAYLKPFLYRNHSISIGPFGGSGGIACDDGVYTTIRKLSIFSGSVIDAIKIEYDKNGHSKWSDTDGVSSFRREAKVI
ncbi:hypothetical protein F0562_019586 [Nyssa sinensis]|uniref:Jacalin-type lectin domain-containing protein n=1 Tax=Nyssa sinensis TaxID=561372 RepID=A0A5J5BNU8_9ASTE|nr:hypothetical protein F0562_019586 [Nyssa sinensis]